MTNTPLLAGIELGGTKAMALLACGDTIIDSLRLPTTSPGSTLAALESWLAAAADRHGAFAALGIASFGPLGLHPGRPGHGCITTTPKPGWSHTDVLHRFAARFGVPTGFDTDVNAAALAEGRWGAARNASVHIYLTIGTGVGAGIVVDGRPVHGLLHPEIGHIRIRRRPGDDFPGACPFHHDCAEGLISGPALALRTGTNATRLPAGDPVWPGYVADLAELLTTLMLTVSPDCILIGGGVGLGQQHLLPALRVAVEARLGNYLPDALPLLRAELIRAPLLGENAGPLGAIALAADALAGP
nr:ROK family protein [Polymorphobacter sp.]